MTTSRAGRAVPDWPPEDVLLAAKVLLVDNYGVEGMIWAATAARAAGIAVVGDLERAGPDNLLAGLVELVDHLVVPLEFAEAWTGRSGTAEAAAALWSDRRAGGGGDLRPRGRLVRRQRGRLSAPSAGLSRGHGQHDRLRRRVSRGLRGRPGRWAGGARAGPSSRGRGGHEGHATRGAARHSHPRSGGNIFAGVLNMSQDTLVAELEQAIAALPSFDVHTHLVGGRLGARGLHDILLYHMADQRPLRGRLSQRRTADAVSRLARPAEAQRADRGSLALSAA